MQKYKTLHENGATPKQIAQIVRQDKLPLSKQLHIVKQLFKLSVLETKQVFASLENKSLEEYQDKFADTVIKLVIDDMNNDLSNDE